MLIYLRVSLNAHILSKGLVLVDLPGMVEKLAKNFTLKHGLISSQV